MRKVQLLIRSASTSSRKRMKRRLKANYPIGKPSATRSHSVR